MQNLPVQKASFVRILIPFIVGIICSYVFFLSYLFVLPAVIGGLFLLLFYLNKKTPSEQYQARSYFGLGMFFIWISAGMITYDIRNPQYQLPSKEDYPCLRVQLSSEPQIKTNHILFNAVLLSGINGESESPLNRQTVLLYFRKSTKVRTLTPNDILLIKNDLLPVKNTGNPDEFDYARYMHMKGIDCMQYISNQWVVVGHSQSFSLKNVAANIQKKAQTIIENTSLTEREQDFFKAILLGVTDDLPDEQRIVFQKAGLSHLLAISGLHVGIIAGFIWGLLYPLKRLGYIRIRYIIVILVLWGYAFICGLSTSVVRACIMATVFWGAYLLKRHSYPVNSLAIAAFFMLLYQPFYLWDIGFQLSFLSVLLILSLIAFQKQVSKNRIINYIIPLIYRTIVIQIGTMALTVYYFHYIPTYSVICNLVMVPLLPVFLAGGILLIVSTQTGGYADNLLSNTLHILFEKSDLFIRYITNLPGATIENLWMNEWSTILGLIVLFLVIIYLYTRNAKYVIVLLSVVTLSLLFCMFNRATPVSEIIVYNQRGSISVNVIDYPQNYIITNDELYAMEETENAARSHWMKIKADSPILITDSLQTKTISVTLPFIQFGDKRLMLLNNESWKEKTSLVRLKIDFLIIGRECKEKISDIHHLFDIGQVILVSDVNPIVASGYEKECSFLGVKCYNTACQGAWRTEM